MEKNSVNFKQFLIESINNFLEQYKRKSDIAYFIDKTVLYCKSYLNVFDDSFINKHGNYIDKNLLCKDHGYVNYISLPKNINKQFTSEFNRILWFEDKEKSITINFEPEYYAYKGAFPYGYLKKYNICVTINLPDNKKEYIRGKITDFTTPEQLEKQFTSSFKGKNYDLLSKKEIDYYRNNSFKKEDYDIIYDYLKLKLNDQKNEIKKVRKQ